MASTKSYLDFMAEVKLQKDIYKKWFADSPNSLINIILSVNTIDLTVDKDIGETASGYNKDAHDYKKASEQNTEKRNKLSAAPLLIMEEIFLLLYSIYPDDFLILSQWGAHISVDGTLILPTDWVHQFLMFKALNDKYLSYAPNPTPIDLYLTENEHVMGDLMLNMDDANAQYANHLSNLYLSSIYIQKRNKIWLPVWKRTIIARNFIIKLFVNDPTKVLDYGISESEAKPNEVEQESWAEEGRETKIGPLVFDSTIKNLNNFPVTIICGRTNHGRELIIKANGELKVAKGMSHVRLKNSYSKTKAKISATVTRKR